MKHLTLFTLLFLIAPFGWGAGNKHYGVTVTQLISKANETEDTTYLSLSAKRCAAMLNLVNGILLRDTGKARFPDSTENLLVVAMGLDAKKAKDRGASQASIDDIPDRVSDEYTRHRAKYLEWMTDNYDQYGDYWGSDAVMSEELDSCKWLSDTFSE